MVDYNYEILSVDEEQNNMSVKFTSDGREDVIVGTPLPTEGVSLEDFLHPYAPIGYWLEKDRKVFVPQVGVSGQYSVEAYEEKIKQQQLEVAEQFANSNEGMLLRELQVQSTKDLVKEVLAEEGIIASQ